MKMTVVGINLPTELISTLLMSTLMLLANSMPTHDETEETDEKHNQIELLGVGEIAGSHTDKSGLTEPLEIQFENGQENPQPVVSNMLGGFSAAEYSGSTSTF